MGWGFWPDLWKSEATCKGLSMLLWMNLVAIQVKESILDLGILDFWWHRVNRELGNSSCSPNKHRIKLAFQKYQGLAHEGMERR